MQLVKGNMLEACCSEFHGWIAGHMRVGLDHTDDLEIKLWRYGEGLQYPKKKFLGKECIIIFGGILVLRLEKGKDRLTLELDGAKSEYVILGSDITKRVEVKRGPAFGVTIRWPSAPGINVVV